MSTAITTTTDLSALPAGTIVRALTGAVHVARDDGHGWDTVGHETGVTPFRALQLPVLLLWRPDVDVHAIIRASALDDAADAHADGYTPPGVDPDDDGGSWLRALATEERGSDCE